MEKFIGDYIMMNKNNYSVAMLVLASLELLIQLLNYLK